MGSDANKMSDGTSFQPSEPALCANGCGFFGTAATMNLCSKCFRDLRIKQEQAASAKAAMVKIVNKNHPLTFRPPAPVIAGSDSIPPPPSSDDGAARPNRCLICNKKVGVVGWKCRCGSTYCGTHRYPEKHNCDFDYKGLGEKEISEANPVVKKDKVERI